MADPTNNPVPDQINRSFPIDDNGKPVMDVLPAAWAGVRFLTATIPSDEATQLLAAIDIVDPSSEDEGLPVAKTMEIVSWLILNYNEDVTVWWGDVNVEPGFGVPIRRAVFSYTPEEPSDPADADLPDDPGTALLKVDPAAVYVYQNSGSAKQLTIGLVGRNLHP